MRRVKMKVLKIELTKSKEDKDLMLIVSKNKKGTVKVKDFTDDEEDLMALWALTTNFFMDALLQKYDFSHRDIYKAMKSALEVGVTEFEQSLRKKNKEDED